MTFKFRLEDSFYQMLLQRLEAARLSANDFLRRLRSPESFFFKRIQEYSSTSLPTEKHLKKLVETVFWTSLNKEEGRSLTFSVDFAFEPPTSGVDGFIFDSPLLFNIGTLTKLAPAAGHQEMSILVGTRNKNLQVIGLCDYSTGPLTFKALDPGQLIIRFGGDNLAVVSGEGARFIREPLLARRVFSNLHPCDQSDENFPFADRRIQTILDISRQMRRLDHGGTLVIVPTEMDWVESTDKQRKYSGKHSILADMLRTIKKVKDRSGLERLLPQYARKIAQLTAVDGATVLTADLDVIEFGVKFREKANSGKSIEPKNIYPFDETDQLMGKSPRNQFGGMRHQSAARFVFEQPEAIALVVSQDGEVTGFVSEEFEGDLVVTAYRRLELSLF